MTVRPYPLAAALVASLVAAALAQAGDTPPNWPMTPADLERRFNGQEFTIREVKSAGGGVTGADRLGITYSDGTTLNVKWKVVPARTADGWNNSPRKELAAYAMQHYLFDANDYAVPTATLLCIPLEAYKPIDGHARATFDGSACVLGVMAVWLDNVTVPDEIWDEARFANDAAYARAMADLNVLTYLVDHRDGRKGNLLLSTVEGDPRVFAVDNGIAFNPFPWNFLVRNWNKIRVPWLRRETVEKLRSLDRPALAELGVLAELDRDKQGIFRAVKAGPNMDAARGVRIQGSRVQFGLTAKEVDEVEERITDLLRKIDAGKIPLR